MGNVQLGGGIVLSKCPRVNFLHASLRKGMLGENGKRRASSHHCCRLSHDKTVVDRVCFNTLDCRCDADFNRRPVASRVFFNRAKPIKKCCWRFNQNNVLAGSSEHHDVRAPGWYIARCIVGHVSLTVVHTCSFGCCQEALVLGVYNSVCVCVCVREWMTSIERPIHFISLTAWRHWHETSSVAAITESQSRAGARTITDYFYENW